jgi:predicted phage terminase large subunit-like protein
MTNHTPPEALSASVLERLDLHDLAAIVAQAKWTSARKPHQIIPEGDWWTVWLLMAGRGAGKTRTAAETIREWAWFQPRTRWLVSAPTYGDLVGVCFEGDSGLLAVIPPECIQKYNKSEMTLLLRNGSLITGISAEKPERFRGPQFHGGWLDELAAWQYADEAWDLLNFGMRLGKHPRIVASTTPKPMQLLRDLIKREGKDVTVTRASTYDNIDNLAPTFKAQILRYEGTTIGRQEIHAELIDLEEAGVIRRSWLQLWPASKPLPVFDFVVLSLDTAYTEETRDKKTGDADFTACTVWGLFRQGKEYGILLLDAWQERLGLPDLIARVKRESKIHYGEDEDKPLITPLFGAQRQHGTGRKPDLIIIEDKGSGISLRQMLVREGIHAYAYNPGRTKKLDRLHQVSPLFANGVVWVPESNKKAGQPRSWCEPVIAQLCAYTGEGSIKHDDLMDSATQALRYLSDDNRLSTTEPMEDPDAPKKATRPHNPYAA